MNEFDLNDQILVQLHHVDSVRRSRAIMALTRYARANPQVVVDVMREFKMLFEHDPDPDVRAMAKNAALELRPLLNQQAPPSSLAQTAPLRSRQTAALRDMGPFSAPVIPSPMPQQADAPPAGSGGARTPTLLMHVLENKLEDEKRATHSSKPRALVGILEAKRKQEAEERAARISAATRRPIGAENEPRRRSKKDQLERYALRDGKELPEVANPYDVDVDVEEAAPILTRYVDLSPKARFKALPDDPQQRRALFGKLAIGAATAIFGLIVVYFIFGILPGYQQTMARQDALRQIQWLSTPDNLGYGLFVPAGTPPAGGWRAVVLLESGDTLRNAVILGLRDAGVLVIIPALSGDKRTDAALNTILDTVYETQRFAPPILMSYGDSTPFAARFAQTYGADLSGVALVSALPDVALPTRLDLPYLIAAAENSAFAAALQAQGNPVRLALGGTPEALVAAQIDALVAFVRGA